MALFLAFNACSAIGSELGKFSCDKSLNADYDLEHNELGNAIAADFLQEDFKALVQAATSWKDGRCLLSSGESRIGYWLSGFTKAFKYRQDWQASLIQIEKFKAAYPGSVLPALAEARYWSDYANNARGFGVASTVSPEGWKLFRERLEKSESILMKIQAKAGEWPQWYLQLIRVQSLLGRPKEALEKTFLDGIKKYPEFLPIYMERSYYLEPRWGGSWAAVDTMVQLAVGNVRRESKAATYTRMYWATAKLASSPDVFFSETKVVWSRMRDGFTDLLKSYPDSAWLGNNFLFYACVAGDQKAYKEHRERVKKHDDRLWTLDDRNSCDVVMHYDRK